jgi:hypothetical protein
VAITERDLHCAQSALHSEKDCVDETHEALMFHSDRAAWVRPCRSSPTADLTIPDPTIASVHAEIECCGW